MKRLFVMLGALTFVLMVASAAFAQEPAAGAREITLAHGLLGLAAALAVAFGAIGTAWAQSRIGSAAAGAMAERPELGGLMIVFMALPETLIILGFVVALLIIGRI